MDSIRLKNWVIKSLVVGFFIAAYTIYGNDIWTKLVSSTGHAGVFEVGLGYAGITFLSFIVSWYLTKNLRGKPHED